MSTSSVLPSRRALVATGATLLAALALNTRWLPVWLMAALLPLATLAILARWRGAGPLPTLWRILLLVGACAAIAATQPSVFGREAGAALLASMLVLKYLETTGIRDARLVVMVSNFLAMAAFLRDQSFAQTGLTIALLLLVLVALQWLRTDRMEPAADAAAQPSLRDWRPPLREALLALAVAVPFALVSFLLFPRLATPLWGSLDERPRGRVGIDDELELGALSGLALDDSPAFRVRFDKDGPAPPPVERYWRGLVLWTFNGRVWRGSRRFLGTGAGGDIGASGRRYAYEITLVDSPKTWRFALDLPLTTPDGMQRSVDLQITGPAGPRADRRYRATSATRYRLHSELPFALQQAGLELPAASNPRAVRLAKAWRARHGTNVDAIVKESLDMIREGFMYSLDPPPVSGQAIDEFLFSTRIGFCEHFASSFVFLMRAAGIPARIVTGYQGGDRNAVGRYWIVRQSDAHAWAEIWVAGRGWVRVDPTAAVAPERVLRGGSGFGEGADAGWLGDAGWWAGLRDRADLLGSWWQQAVVGFDALRQTSLLQRLGIAEEDRARHVVLWLALVMATLGLAALLLTIGRAVPASPWIVLYREFVAKLASGGVVRNSTEGPVEFSERAATHLPHRAGEIRSIAKEFIALRYAREHPVEAAGDTRLASLRRRVRDLKLARARDAKGP